MVLQFLTACVQQVVASLCSFGCCRLELLTHGCCAAAVPVMLIGKDKEALGVGGTQRAKPLVDACVSVLGFVQHHTHDDDICHCLMLQKIHLQSDVKDSALVRNTWFVHTHPAGFRSDSEGHWHFTLAAN